MLRPPRARLSIRPGGAASVRLTGCVDNTRAPYCPSTPVTASAIRFQSLAGEAATTEQRPTRALPREATKQ